MDYLEWHKTQWRVRRTVPPPLRVKIGKRTLLQSTGTDDYDRAVKIAKPIIREHDRIIARAAGKPNGRVHLRHSDADRRSSEWYTPAHVFEAMPGVTFDQDVASPGAAIVPWIPAGEHITEKSLEREWRGFVWMNAPYGVRYGMMSWLQKFVAHGNGVCLLPNSTYTRWWRYIADRADAVLFIQGYVRFISPTDPNARATSFGSVLVGIGDKAVAALNLASANGLGMLTAPAASGDLQSQR